MVGEVGMAGDVRALMGAVLVGGLVVGGVVAYALRGYEPGKAEAAALAADLSQQKLLQVCAAAAGQGARAFVLADGLSPVIGGEIQSVASPDGAVVVTCPVKTRVATGWLNARLTCGDMFGGCIETTTVALGGEALARR